MPDHIRDSFRPSGNTRSQTVNYHGRQLLKLPDNWESQVRKYNAWKRKTKKAAKKTGGRRKTRSNRH